MRQTADWRRYVLHTNQMSGVGHASAAASCLRQELADTATKGTYRTGTREWAMIGERDPTHWKSAGYGSADGVKDEAGMAQYEYGTVVKRLRRSSIMASGEVSVRHLKALLTQDAGVDVFFAG